MDPYYEAISYFRRRNYENCIKLCNKLLEQNTQHGNKKCVNNSFSLSSTNEAIWLLKMQSLTQRVFLDDIEMDDDDEESEEIEFERIATAARPGTSIKTAFTSLPRSRLSSYSNKPKTSRPLTGIIRPDTASNRFGWAYNGRPQSRCGTARRVCLTSAMAFSINDDTPFTFQAFRLNPTIYAEKPHIIKPLFQFLFYHEKDPSKALTLCETQKPNWWWDQQYGRCLIALKQFRRAEDILQRSLANCPHPDTYLLLCKTYHALNKNQKALQLLDFAVEKNPWDIYLRIQQARIHEYIGEMEESTKLYKIIARIIPINVEALSCIAVHLFYDNQPEISLMYYRRILSLGGHSAELYCNIALCCLYSGTIDLVLPCFQRAILLASTPEQRAYIWYNLSFVAIGTGDFSLAKRCLRLCLSYMPSYGQALNNLAVLLLQMGEISKAKSYFLAAKNTSIDCPELENNLKVIEYF